jgi:hypothetical protein
MGKAINADVLDGAIAVVRQANRLVALPAQPADYAAAIAARLAEATLGAGDFATAPGLVDGRRVTVAAKAGIAVSASGSANHVALLDAATSRLLYVTTCPAQALSAGGTVDFAAFDVEFGNPV